MKLYRIIAVMGLAALVFGCGAAPSEQSSTTASGILDALKGPTITGVDDTMMASAKEADAAKNYKRSSGFYQQVLDKKPDSLPAKLGLANALRHNNQCNDAMAHFQSVIDKDPANAEAMEGKGLCQMALGDGKQSADTFTQALSIDPHRWRSLNAVGILFSSRGKTNEAIAYFEKAQEEDGSQVAVMNNLALSYLLDKRYDQAIETFRRAKVHLPSKSAEAARIDLNLALAYALGGDMDTAQKLSAPHLSEAGLYNNMGFYAKLAKDESMARDYLNMALSKSPTYYKRAQANLDLIPRGTKADGDDSDGVKIKRLHIPGRPYPQSARSSAGPDPVAKDPQPGEMGAPAIMPSPKPHLVKDLSDDSKPTDNK